MRDRLGNELEVGQIIQVDLNKKVVEGKIIKLIAGGLSVPGTKRAITADVILLHVTITCGEPPGLPHGSIIRMVNPETEIVVPKTKLKEV